jgi:hypothetical protein
MTTSRVLQISTKLQAGVLGKIGRYFKNIYKDYETVAIETWADMRAKKLKSAIYLSILGTSGYLIATNPSEPSFYEQLTCNTNELLMVGNPIRNVHSDSHMQKLSRYHNQRRLRRFTFCVCCVMWVDNFDAQVDLYEAQCKHLKVGWLDWQERIVDVGVAGRWLYLDRAMRDYDINPEEWEDSERAT